MHGDEIRFADEVGAVDGARSETQVRDGLRARFPRVIHKIALRIIVSAFADDFDRVFVGANRPVGTQPVEHPAHHVVCFDAEIGVVIDAGVGHIINNAHGEMVFRFVFFHFFEQTVNHCRGKFFR